MSIECPHGQDEQFGQFCIANDAPRPTDALRPGYVATLAALPLGRLSETDVAQPTVPRRGSPSPTPAVSVMVADLRTTSTAVAIAVAAAAQRDSVAACPPDIQLADAVRAAMWQPQYYPVRAS